MNLKKLNEKLSKIINESEEKTFADWYGEDLTGQTYEGDIDCRGQGLTSLKGAPSKVTGDFKCYGNNLTNLEGAPEYVSGDFDCTDNPTLKSLDGIVEVKGHIKTDIKTKKTKTPSSEIVLNIEATDGVSGNTTIEVNKEFFNWSKEEQAEFLQTEIDDSGSDFYAEEDPDGYNLSYLTIEEINTDETGGSAKGTWEAEYYNEFGDIEEETEIPVTFEFDI